MFKQNLFLATHFRAQTEVTVFFLSEIRNMIEEGAYEEEYGFQ